MATSNAATNYLERRLLHFIFKNNSLSFSSPGDSIYVGLATAVSACRNWIFNRSNLYKLCKTTSRCFKLDNYRSDSTDTQTAINASNIEFPASGGTNNTITHVFIADASSSGNIFFVGALDASKAIASGDIFRINAGNLTIELK